jgi:general secretion pathway protein G
MTKPPASLTFLASLCRRLASPRARRFRTASAAAGFTLLEMIIVVTMIGILAAIALPNLIQQPRRANEAVLKNNLRTLREVIDQYHGDKGKFPSSLEDLVDEDYLRSVPIDPMLGEAEWGVEYEEENLDDTADPYEEDSFDDFEEFDEFDENPDSGGSAGIMDVHSLADGEGLNGTPYAEW